MTRDGATLLDASRDDLHREWSSLTHAMQRLRDLPAAADQEHARIGDAADRGLVPALAFDSVRRHRGALRRDGRAAARRHPARAGRQRPGRDGGGVRPRRLRRARRDHDRHRFGSPGSRASHGHRRLRRLLLRRRARRGRGLGQVDPLRSARSRTRSARSSRARDAFALGVCNGCQMMSALEGMVPGTAHWPRFLRNRSEQFEARLVQLEVADSPSLFFRGMAGQRHPGRDRARRRPGDLPRCRAARGGAGARLAALRRRRGPRDRALPAQPERLARGHRRPHDRRRALHHPDAASRARVAHRADVVGAGRLGRGLALVPHVPQRPRRRWGKLFRSGRPRGVAMKVQVYELDGVVPVVDPDRVRPPDRGADRRRDRRRRLLHRPDRGAARRLRADRGARRRQHPGRLHPPRAFPGIGTLVEEDGHIGHGAVLHSCTIQRNALVGMNAVVNDNARRRRLGDRRGDGVRQGGVRRAAAFARGGHAGPRAARTVRHRARVEDRGHAPVPGARAAVPDLDASRSNPCTSGPRCAAASTCRRSIRCRSRKPGSPAGPDAMTTFANPLAGIGLALALPVRRRAVDRRDASTASPPRSPRRRTATATRGRSASATRWRTSASCPADASSPAPAPAGASRS